MTVTMMTTNDDSDNDDDNDDDYHYYHYYDDIDDDYCYWREQRALLKQCLIIEIGKKLRLTVLSQGCRGVKNRGFRIQMGSGNDMLPAFG